jgi:ATP-dependent helicase YprA (DUF1998 family)
MLNPITYTEAVVGDFLRYQLTTYPFADPGLHAQMRALLGLEATRATPLLQGPYISLSQAFRQGAALRDLVAEGVLHPHLPRLASHAHVYGHQEDAFRAIHAGKTTLVATGTGSGKTECFLYPIISHCLALRDREAPAGIAAVLVYPMNALAEDQLDRMRALLAGSGVSFGMYVGKTPERAAEVTGQRLTPGASREDYFAALRRARRDGHAVHPPEERVSREEMRAPGQHPRILLTNVKQLELLLTRQRDVELFDQADLRFLVFDEAHTFSGAQGGEAACLVRRLRAFCEKRPDEVVCVATSATIADPVRGPEAGRAFAARFFGVSEDRVALVGESYEADRWHAERASSPPLAGDPAVQLHNVLEAVRDVEGEEPPPAAVKALIRVFQSITGQKLDAADWQARLHERLSRSEVVFQIAQALRRPRALAELVQELAARVGRPVPEEEVLVWLALGAIARHEGRPLLRPVVHAFVRGMAGAVVTFPRDQSGPRLWLSREEAIAGGSADLRKLDLTTCTSCGQHYFVHHVEDFEYTDAGPRGGRAEGESAHWPALDEAHGGRRLILIDRIVGGEDDDAAAGSSDDEAGEEGAGNGRGAAAQGALAAGRAAPAPGMAPLFLCRACGALHREPGATCRECGRPDELVALYAVRQRAEHPGHLTRCLSCGAHGRRWGSNYREPARPVRAVTVSDVHVLAQNMLQYAERRRLIIFADNRQDAAFQAGWMQDHARRYRLRALMYERITQGALSVGDLTAWLDARLEADDELSQALIPEVWRVARKEAVGQQHAQERRYFLRIQVLREIAVGLRQRIGLEPWGRLEVLYHGLDAALPLFQRWAHAAGCTPERMREAAALLLDVSRRSGALYDREHEIFTRWWSEGDTEVQRGYLAPVQGGPKALKRERELDDKARLGQWLSTRGQTRAVQMARKWQIPEDEVRTFLGELWALCADDLALLVPVTLRNAWGKPLPGTTGARQIDADRLLLGAHRGLWRCRTCRRTQLRSGPHDACIQWRCAGTVEREEEDGDDYDLMVLDKAFAQVRAREHSAQVPAEEREMLERMFKGQGEHVNTLVATPTLELGVDIGGLDAVLMRNVPPLPANYWQRVGRAGRRHRMAVNLTYASAKAHDRAYFADPLKLLEGRIDPPRFNLANELMVRKHVHAAVLSVLHQLARPGRGLGDEQRAGIAAALARCFPEQVKGFLFSDTGELRRGHVELAPLAEVLEAHRAAILSHVIRVFTDGWPEVDRDVVAPARLAGHVDALPARLAEVIERLERRLRWALEQMNRLDLVRQRKGTLDPAEDALRTRCDELVKKLKGIRRRRRQEAEGYDDTLTYSVLAAEGFLPGYGLETGSVLAFHRAPRYAAHLRDVQLRRPLALALREYVPGNFLYANGHRFYPRYFHMQAGARGESIEPLLFEIDVEHEAVREHGTRMRLGEGAAGLGAALLPAVPMCDVDAPHQSHIADDEDYRFQLPVTIFGHERDRHGGGQAYVWGQRRVHLRRQVHLRLVNVGARRLVVDEGRFGYPLCLVCGQSRSSLASQREREEFGKSHLARCGQKVEDVGFYADDVADALSLQDCAGRIEAYSLAEALRLGAADVLEMEREDLQVLIIARPGSEAVDALLYDPMPGGSGLLDQMVQRWSEVVAAALRIAAGCPSQCDVACVDCLQYYRNAWSQPYLDRHVAAAELTAAGTALAVAHEIPPKLPTAVSGGLPVNQAEATLADMLRRAGFPAPELQKPLDLGLPLGTTTPDFFYDDPAGRYEGICIYVDGLGAGSHGTPDARRRDARLREQLRSDGYEVIAIAASELSDAGAMIGHLSRLARVLLGKEQARAIKEDTRWFAGSDGGGDGQ